MGIYRRQRKYYIDYYSNGRRVREAVGESRKLAEIILKKRKVEIAEGKHLDIRRHEKIRFEDFADEYLELHSKPNNKSWEKSDLQSINRLKQSFSGKYLYEITPFMVDKFKMERAKEVSPASVNKNLACLKSMFNRAIEWGKTKENPVNKVRLFKQNNERLRYLEKEEIPKVLASCNGHLRPIVIIALNTGMRRGEILGLKWHDIDFRRNIIYLYNTKNSEKREIPINEQVKTALIRVRRHPDSPYVFCKADGTHYGNVRKSFFTALRKAGIINFRFHDLRHTFASHLVMAGVDLNTVRDLMGHKSTEMTLRYAHLSPNHKQRAVNVLGRRIDTNWSQEALSPKLEKELLNITGSKHTR